MIYFTRGDRALNEVELQPVIDVIANAAAHLCAPSGAGELIKCVHCGATEHSYQQEWDHAFESLYVKPAAVACGCVEKVREYGEFHEAESKSQDRAGQSVKAALHGMRHTAANEIIAALPAPAAEGEAMRRACIEAIDNLLGDKQIGKLKHIIIETLEKVGK